MYSGVSALLRASGKTEYSGRIAMCARDSRVLIFPADVKKPSQWRALFLAGAIMCALGKHTHGITGAAIPTDALVLRLLFR